MTKREEIEKLLLKTDIKGMGGLILAMREGGFYEAPCSGKYHLAKAGGLAEHSLNVLSYMQFLQDALEPKIPDRSIIICGLLHDLGKMGQYGKPNYIPAEDGTYKTSRDLLYMDHEVRSVAIASKYIDLTEEEQWAITMHNGLYGAFADTIKGKETELYMLLHFADMWCSRVVEK